MNGPSFDKFVPNVRAGGKAYIDSSIVEVQSDRSDVDCQYIPATKLASENGLPNSLGIIIMLGKMIKDSGLADFETIKKAIAESTDKADLITANAKAIEIGMNL
jgi:2-oxoglutarate ferredoxin oxidoreductase subunit gamma